MRRTLLAIGLAVLASMLFAPHERIWGLDIWGDKWGSYWWTYFPVFCRHVYYRRGHVVTDVIWPSFFAQTAFVAVLNSRNALSISLDCTMNRPR
jgi:hypothetical protein